MTQPLRDIRELAGNADAYRDELFRRWTGLLSYRYIGRKYSSMDTGEEDNTVTLRRDMRNAVSHAYNEGKALSVVAGVGPFLAEVKYLRDQLKRRGRG